MPEKSSKKVLLTPDAFQVNSNGEVVINNDQVARALSDSIDQIDVGDQGIKVSVSVSSE